MTRARLHLNLRELKPLLRSHDGYVKMHWREEGEDVIRTRQGRGEGQRRSPHAAGRSHLRRPCSLLAAGTRFLSILALLLRLRWPAHTTRTGLRSVPGNSLRHTLTSSKRKTCTTAVRGPFLLCENAMHHLSHYRTRTRWPPPRPGNEGWNPLRGLSAAAWQRLVLG